MGWGTPRRPKVSTKLGNPNPREGSDGDIQIKGTALGAKLWGKWSGGWWDIPLSKDGVTKFGVTDSNYLSIDRDSVDIFTDKVKVASFGSTTTVKDINLTGKVVITSTGSQNVCIGTGNNDIGTDNISIGVDSGSSLEAGALKNICIGTKAGEDLTTGDENIFIGTQAGLDSTVSLYNTVIGALAAPLLASGSALGLNTIVGAGAGGVLTTGYGNVYIGAVAVASDGARVNEVVLSGHTGAAGGTGKGSHTVLLGNGATQTVYCGVDGDADLQCGDLKLSFTGLDLEFKDAARTGATEQDWVEVEVGGNQGYIRVYALK